MVATFHVNRWKNLRRTCMRCRPIMLLNYNWIPNPLKCSLKYMVRALGRGGVLCQTLWNNRSFYSSKSVFFYFYSEISQCGSHWWQRDSQVWRRIGETPGNPRHRCRGLFKRTLCRSGVLADVTPATRFILRLNVVTPITSLNYCCINHGD